jgi:hypothetical protein
MKTRSIEVDDATAIALNQRAVERLRSLETYVRQLDRYYDPQPIE